MNVVTELKDALGKFYIVAGLVPALLFTLAHSLLASSALGKRLPSWAPGPPQLDVLLDGELKGDFMVLLLSALVPIVLGMLLMMLSQVLIQLFEGRPDWLRYGPLWPFLHRNRKAWQKEQEKFAEAGGDRYWQAYENLSVNYELQEDEGQKQTRKSLQKLARRLTRMEDNIEKDLGARRWPRFPARKEMVLPTAMGNAWAVIEEYPFRRYGMDGVFYWPRLLPLLGAELDDAPFAASLASHIADQKTAFDFLFHSALLTGFLGLEMVVLSLFDLSPAQPVFALDWRSLVGGLAVFLVAYWLYRAAVDSVYVLGNFIATSYDLLRPALASALGLTRPATPDEEYHMWRKMGLFLRRGRPYYHPASLSKQPVLPATGDEPGGGDQVEPELEEAYRVFKVPEPSQEPPA